MLSSSISFPTTWNTGGVKNYQGNDILEQNFWQTACLDRYTFSHGVVYVDLKYMQIYHKGISISVEGNYVYCLYVMNVLLTVWRLQLRSLPSLKPIIKIQTFLILLKLPNFYGIKCLCLQNSILYSKSLGVNWFKENNIVWHLHLLPPIYSNLHLPLRYCSK